MKLMMLSHKLHAARAQSVQIRHIRFNATAAPIHSQIWRHKSCIKCGDVERLSASSRFPMAPGSAIGRRSLLSLILPWMAGTCLVDTCEATAAASEQVGRWGDDDEWFHGQMLLHPWIVSRIQHHKPIFWAHQESNVHATYRKS